MKEIVQTQPDMSEEFRIARGILAPLIFPDPNRSPTAMIAASILAGCSMIARAIYRVDATMRSKP